MLPDAASNADAEAAEDEQLADELELHHRHHHAGLAGFVISSVETLGIAPDQQAAVDGIRKEYRAKMKPLHEANGTVLQLLADGISTGNIDKAKVDAAVASAGTASETVQGATQSLLTELHGVLRPEQRVALVDKVDAHWAVWREANASGHADGAKPDAEKDARKPFDPAASEAYVKAFDTAFAEGTFDAKKLPASGPESSRIVSWGAHRMAWFYEALAPVLTADQRTTLAERLRQRASGPGSREKP
jgi:Spy/CpxP family protein refolding chaperone